MNQGTIFINYRKQDSEWKTETFYKELLNHFDQNSIFKDFTTIEPGEDFTVAINRNLNKCNVFLVIIGKDWLDIKNSAGKRRLDDPVDFVRIEIATTLKRGIRVIPVLFDNIEMPLKETLPEDLQALCNRQAISVDKVSLKSDVERLAVVINKEFRSPPVGGPPPIDKPKPDALPSTPHLSFSKTDIILSVIVGIGLLINTYLVLRSIKALKSYGSDEIYKPQLMYEVILVFGILSIILSLGKTRLTNKNLLIISSLFLFASIIILWGGLSRNLGIVANAVNLILAGFLSLLIWKRKYMAAQVIILIVIVVFTVFLINFSSEVIKNAKRGTTEMVVPTTPAKDQRADSSKMMADTAMIKMEEK